MVTVTWLNTFLSRTSERGEFVNIEEALFRRAVIYVHLLECVQWPGSTELGAIATAQEFEAF